MDRLNQLIELEQFIAYLEKINLWEKDRFFCRHGFEHGLNVARIAYVYLLEKGELDLSKECIYAAAVLHDIGRWVEYETGADHAEASALLARPLLEACRFEPEDIQVILTGIREHRRHQANNLSPLGEALALADDWARSCLYCGAQALCSKYNQNMNKVVY